MSVTAVIQARMASSRLPGKAVLPLDGIPVIQHAVRRARAAPVVENVVVATTFHVRDDIVERYATEAGASVYRGSEDDVLGRVNDAARTTDSEVIVRLTGDNPLIAPELIDAVGRAVLDENLDYASNKLDRTFPLGVDAEAVTVESLAEVEATMANPEYREHALKYYRNHPGEFRTRNLTVTDVYDDDILDAGPELRLTLDEPADYELFQEIYDRLDYEKIVDVQEAVRLIRAEGLDRINERIDQRTL